MTHFKYQKYTGTACGSAEMFTSASFPCDILLASYVLPGFWCRKQLFCPSPTAMPAPSCYFSEFLNGDHVSCPPNVWSELAFEDCRNDLC